MPPVLAQEVVNVALGSQREVLGAQVDEELPLLVLLQQRRYAAQLRIHQAVTAPERILAGQHGGVGVIGQKVGYLLLQFGARALVHVDQVVVAVVVNRLEQALELIGIAMNQNEVGNHVYVSCVGGRAAPTRTQPQAADLMLVLVEWPLSQKMGGCK